MIAPFALESGHHQARLYALDVSLEADVARLVTRAISRGHGAVIVATASHWAGARAQIEAGALDLAPLQESGRVIVLDAHELLGELLERGSPSQRRFDALVRPALARARAAAPIPRVAAFGEMVDVLWERARFADAEALELIWEAAVPSEGTALLCAYRVDLFDPDVPASALRALVRGHSGVQVGDDPARQLTSVQRAIDEVLGAGRAGMVDVVTASECRGRTPTAADVVVWLRTNMPRLARDVLARARVHAAA
jgi:hypothetical protein